MTIEGRYLVLQTSAFQDYLKSIFLIGIRLGGLFIFAPIFSSSAIIGKLKVVFLIVLTISIAPILSVHRSGHVDLGISTMARELAISMVFGLSLSLIVELANTAGQVVGMQFSFTLVNLLDPNSNIETPIISQMFQLVTTTILVSSGFDRIMISAIIRTYTGYPVGGGAIHISSGLVVIEMVSVILIAALQLIAPLIAATVLVEISIALLSRLCPQLPILALTIPAKTIVGFGVLILTLGSWTLFIEREFTLLLDFAQVRVMQMFNA